jgi:voltage-gated potassium channel
LSGWAGLRRRVYHQLEPAARAKPGLSPANQILVVMILVAAVSAILETEPLVAAGREWVFTFLEDVFGAIFLVEYILRLWIAVENPQFARYRFPRLRYAISPIAIIDLLAVLPTLLAFSGGGTLVLRFFRILRMLRLAKLGRTSTAWKHIRDACYSRRFEFALTFIIFFVAALVSGSMLYWAEADAQPDKFGSIPRAIWWAIITLTTVGYGDVYPITPLGRAFAAFSAILGILVIALPAGILAASFSEALQKKAEAPPEGEAPRLDG